MYARCGFINILLGILTEFRKIEPLNCCTPHSCSKEAITFKADSFSIRCNASKCLGHSSLRNCRNHTIQCLHDRDTIGFVVGRRDIGVETLYSNTARNTSMAFQLLVAITALRSTVGLQIPSPFSSICVTMIMNVFTTCSCLGGKQGRFVCEK